MLEQALHAATAIDDPSWRARALRELAPHLPADEKRKPEVAQAVAATTIDDPFSLAETLAELAAHLPADEKRKPEVAQAVQAATTIDDPSSRARALTAIALAESKNGAASDHQYWREALRAAARVDRNSVFAVLPAVLTHAPPKAASHAVESLIRVQRWWP